MLMPRDRFKKQAQEKQMPLTQDRRWPAHVQRNEKKQDSETKISGKIAVNAPLPASVLTSAEAGKKNKQGAKKSEHAV